MYKNLQLIKEIPNIFKPTGNKTSVPPVPLRIYRSEEKTNDDKLVYRYHFGFPEKFISPFCPLIESTPYWGEQHWKELERFWIWYLPILVNSSDEWPKEKLSFWYDFYAKQYQMCLKFMLK